MRWRPRTCSVTWTGTRSSRSSWCRASSSTSSCGDRLSAPGYVAVIGPGDASPGELQAAEEVGAGLARAGAIVVTGGLGGVMEAACRGAKSQRGRTVGILPGLDREDANGWVDVALPTGLGELRNGLVVRAADAVVAVGGGAGTLSEIGFALKLGRPVFGLGTWQVHGVEHVATAAAALAGVVAVLAQ